jgi:hypothetical protein
MDKRIILSKSEWRPCSQYAEPKHEIKLFQMQPVKLGKIKILWWTVDLDNWFTASEKRRNK